VSRVSVNADLGLMLYDVFDLSQPGSDQSGPAVSLFRASVTDGVMMVPPYEDEAVLKTATGGSQ
jgi:CRISPR-associated protein Cas5d